MLRSRVLRSFLPFRRSFASCTEVPSGGGENRNKNSSLIGEKRISVPTFGSFCVSGPFHVVVESLGPHEYPNLDTAKIKILGSSVEDRDNLKWDAMPSASDPKAIFLKMDSVKSNSKSTCDIWAHVKIPIVHNVSVSTRGRGSVDVSDFMESEYCHLKSENGNINAARIKTKDLSLQTTGSGDIICHGLMQAKTTRIISSGSGNVISEKRFTGPQLDILTERGDIRVASSYSEQSKFATHTGNMHLRNIHNESYIAVYEKGDVSIQGVDGSTNIFVKKGDIDVQISLIKHESRIHAEEGDIHLKIMDTFPLKIAIDANEIIPDASFKKHGQMDRKDGNYVHYFATIQPDQFSPTLVVIAENGRVLLEAQSWISSLGLKMDPMKDAKQLD